MTEDKKYWRDAVMKLLAWGTTILGAIAFLALNDSQKYELVYFTHPRERTRAVILLVFVFGYTIAWFLGTRWVYKRHLSQDVDQTVLGWPAVRAFLIVVIASMWTLALATTVRTRPPKPEEPKTCVLVPSTQVQPASAAGK